MHAMNDIKPPALISFGQACFPIFLRVNTTAIFEFLSCVQVLHSDPSLFNILPEPS
jgi:hypothetical protein